MSEPVKILWTGGWDSTFRVLTVLLMEGRSVEPYYIVDTLRQSSLRELRAMGEIRKALDKLSPDAGARFGRLRITVKSDIPEDPAITALWKQLRRRFDIAIQYDWLARWAQLHNLTDLELCVEKEGGIYALLAGHMEQAASGAYRVKPGAIESGELFARFAFPVLELSKLDMRAVALEHGFLEILEKSWFCHRPIFKNPCGICAPCNAVVRHGLGYRITPFGLLLNRLRRLVLWVIRKGEA